MGTNRNLVQYFVKILAGDQPGTTASNEQSPGGKQIDGHAVQTVVTAQGLFGPGTVTGPNKPRWFTVLFAQTEKI